MATSFNIPFARDDVAAWVLASFEDDAAAAGTTPIVELRKAVRAWLRDRARGKSTTALQEAANAALRDQLAALEAAYPIG